jgi:hypothetical protein
VLLDVGNVMIAAANIAAQSLVGVNRPEIACSTVGEVIECVNVDLPGGCGKAECCRACTIRNTVVNTLATDCNFKHVPAYQDVRGADGVQRTRFLISTEKVGDAVLLKIDEGRCMAHD